MSPSPATFAATLAGQTRDLDVVVTNTGGGAVTVTPSVSSGAFTLPLLPTVCAGGGNVATPGSPCAVRVRFSPTAIGPASGTLTLNTTAGQFLVSLSGTGLSPLAAAPTTLAFPGDAGRPDQRRTGRHADQQQPGAADRDQRHFRQHQFPPHDDVWCDARRRAELFGKRVVRADRGRSAHGHGDDLERRGGQPAHDLAERPRHRGSAHVDASQPELRQSAACNRERAPDTSPSRTRAICR